MIRSRGYVSVLALAEPTAPESAWMSGGSVDVIEVFAFENVEGTVKAGSDERLMTSSTPDQR